MTGAEAARNLRLAGELHRMSRRSFLAGSALGISLAADLAVTRAVQERRKQMEILTVDDEETRRRFPASGWILFPGYKTSWEESLWILSSLGPVLRERGQMAAVGYSNLGIDAGDIAAAVLRHAQTNGLRRLYFYGHSFGGMLAVETAARLRASSIPVELIVLDSSPRSKFDVLDRTWFERVVFLYEAGYRVPSLVRGGYELGERIVHKNERSWWQILDQTLEQVSPLAPSSVLIQSQSSYIYHFDATRFEDRMGDTPMAFIGNPEDRTVNYRTARDGWASHFRRNMVSADLRTEGASPAHASPQWNGRIYQPIIASLQKDFLPQLQAGGGGRVTMH